MPDMDMRRMQEEAARRAREMQSRARQPRQRPPGQNGGNSPAPHQPPPERPQPAPPPPPEAPAKPPALPESAGNLATASLLDDLFKDRERTVLLALLILLSGEESNHELMFALLFLLM